MYTSMSARNKVLIELITKLVSNSHGDEFNKEHLNIEVNKQVASCFSVNDYCRFTLKFFENPLYNCGMFCMAGASYLYTEQNRSLILNIIKLFGVTFSRHLILLNDTCSNFEEYKHIFGKSIITKSIFNNPNSDNDCINYIVDLRKLKFTDSSFSNRFIDKAYGRV